MGIVKAKTITPLQAIRKYCLQCSCGDKKEVDECTISGCPLYVFRLGEPKTTKDEKEPIITPGDMLDKPKCIIKEEKSMGLGKCIEPILKVEPTPSVNGTICGEEPIITETVTPIKLTKENFVISKEEAEKHRVIVEPIPSVNGTGTICGEDIVFAESKQPNEDGNNSVIDLDNVERTEHKPVKEKKQTKKKVEQPVAESKPEKKQDTNSAVEENKDDEELDDIDLDDLFD